MQTRSSRRHVDRGALIWALMITGWACYAAGVTVLVIGLADDSWRASLIGVAVLFLGLVVDFRRFTRVTHRRQVQILGMLFDKASPAE